MNSTIVVRGGKPLYGSVDICGSKNAALPIVFASLLVNGVCEISNLPPVSDVNNALEIISSLGARISRINKDTVSIDASHISMKPAPEELCRKMRASYYLIGAQLGRFWHSHTVYPGGCDFGVRPIDQHIDSFKKMGATINTENGFIESFAPEGGLVGTNIFLNKVSVGTTVNIMLAATLSRGLTTIENAAKEPHIVDLANFLVACGAEIKGAGTETIKIQGVESLHGCEYSVVPDMIEAGTYMTAVASAGGDVTITNVIPKHLESMSAKLTDMGVQIIQNVDSLRVIRDPDVPLRGCNIVTAPYPGFPTDMHPQFSALLCFSKDVSTMYEAVWDNRFRYISELRRMGVSAEVNDRMATFRPVDKITGASVCACDLRAGAAMIIAGLAAEGVTKISDIHLIERGYDNIVGKLHELGADIHKEYQPSASAYDIAN